MTTSPMNVSTQKEVKSDDAVMSKFNIFTLRANQRIYQEVIAKRNLDRNYIEALEAILRENNLDLPEVERDIPLPRKSRIGSIDGSPEALNELLMKVKGLQRVYHVQICFKDIGYWTMSQKAHIPTVGTRLKDMFFGHGPKHRVDILKGLTGRIFN
jgi:hypothetical protein